MSTHIAELELASSAFADAPDSVLGTIYGDQDVAAADGQDSSTGIARGIVSVVLISIPFWALFAFAVYLVM